MRSIKKRAKKGTFMYPEINFDAETGICELIGESYVEHPEMFYEPLLNWLEEFCESGKPLVFNFKISYFNSTSSKSILDILQILKKYEDAGGKVNVNWYYDEYYRDDMEDEIDRFTDVVGITINKHCVNEIS